MTQYKLVPVEPTDEQWGGLARDIMHWLDMYSGSKTPRTLLEHLRRSGKAVPQWLLDEPEMKNLDHSMSKGTRCVIIYKAMLAAAPAVNPWVSVDERLPKVDGFYRCAHEPDSYGDCSWKERGFTGMFTVDVTHWWDESILPIPRPKED